MGRHSGWAAGSLLLAGAVCAWGQRALTFSVVGGTAVTDTLNTYQSSGRFGGAAAQSATRRLVLGANISARLNAHFAVDLGVLHRRFGYDYQTYGPFPVPIQFTTFQGTGASWEMPLRAKWYVFGGRQASPYVALGGTYRWLADWTETQSLYNNFNLTTPILITRSSDNPPVLLQSRNAIAPTAAAGVEFRSRHIRVWPEVRYTRWVSDTLGSFGAPLRWNWQQVDFVLGIGWGVGRR